MHLGAFNCCWPVSWRLVCAAATHTFSRPASECAAVRRVFCCHWRACGLNSAANFNSSLCARCKRVPFASSPAAGLHLQPGEPHLAACVCLFRLVNPFRERPVAERRLTRARARAFIRPAITKVTHADLLAGWLAELLSLSTSP